MYTNILYSEGSNKIMYWCELIMYTYMDLTIMYGITNYIMKGLAIMYELS